MINAQNEIDQRRSSRKSPHFMIIEDDVFSRRLVENVLQKQYPLTGLGEATNSLQTYSRIAPDLLFLDINLPDVTGHELLERIISIDPKAYVIMLSGNADRENIMQAMRKGAKGFVAKPFTKDKLFQYIERCPTIANIQHA
jgi:two-component system chemotaxis response regulator CheY